MGIEVFDTAPDNKGGRPKKEEQEDDQSTGAKGDPSLLMGGEQDWLEAIEELGIEEIKEDIHEGDIIGSEQISNLADHAHCFPESVRIHLEAHGIYETDWSNAPDYYHDDNLIVDQLEELGVENEFTRDHERDKIREETSHDVSDGFADIIAQARNDS